MKIFKNDNYRIAFLESKINSNLRVNLLLTKLKTYK